MGRSVLLRRWDGVLLDGKECVASSDGVLLDGMECC